MRALLASLIRIAQRTGRFTVAQATDIYNGLWRIIGFALLACVAAFVMNAGFGRTTPSLVLAIVFAIVAIYMWAKPLHILVVAGFGVASRIATDAALATEIEEVLRNYLGFLKWVLLAGVTFLFIAGTISFKENPGAILPLLVALGVYGLFTWAWPDVFAGTWGRKLVYWYAILVIALSFGSLFSGAVWAKYTGWDPATAKPTATADRLYRLDKTEREQADDDQAKKLEIITAKIKRHEELTGADKEVIAKARQSQVSEKPATPAHATASTAQPPPQKLMLSIPANGNVRVRVPDGHGAAFTGHGFSVLCMYEDGTEDTGTPVHSCNGPMAYQVVHDESGQPNLVMYEIVQGTR